MGSGAWPRKSALQLALAAAAWMSGLGCGDIFHATNWESSCGSSEGECAGPGTGGGGAVGGGGAAGIGGSGGVASGCDPGETRSCYSGPADTVDIGSCREGTETCDDDGAWGPCEDEVLPASDACETPDDEDCDGTANDGCPETSCKALHDAIPGLANGLYDIDPDGPGGVPVISAFCDMTTGGGGWTLLAKTVKAGLTAAEKDAVRESFWLDYTETGYGDPQESSRIYWMPLVYWNLLTVAHPTNELVSRTSSADVRVTMFTIGDASQDFRWDWAVDVGSTPILDSLKGQAFTARDEDNDMWPGNCSSGNVGLNGGFWYSSCGQLSMLHSDGNIYRLDTNAQTSVTFNEIWLR